MNVIKTAIDTDSSAFNKNADVMHALVNDWREKLDKIMQGGSTRAKKKHTERGKLLVRDRVALLLDADSPFLEFSQFAGYKVYDDSIPAAGIITGIGRIEKKECVIIANDATVKGGAYYPLTAKKHLRAQEIAEHNQLPCIYLVDSGGAFLPKQAEVFADRDHFGRIFFNQANMSAKGIPQIAVIMGSCTAGGAYIPAMSDESIIVKDEGTIFLAGPPLVKAATGEEASAEELGGAEVHARHSGLVDHVADDDKQAIAKARRIVSDLTHTKHHFVPVINEFTDPIYLGEDIYGIVPANFRHQYTKEVISPAEAGVDKHAGNRFSLDRLGNGNSAQTPGDIWLLPYWMGRYLGVISAPIKN